MVDLLYNVIFITAVALLILSARYLLFLNRKLYVQSYGQHLIFEGVTADPLADSKLLKRIQRPSYRRLILYFADLLNFGLIIFYKFYQLPLYDRLYDQYLDTLDTIHLLDIAYVIYGLKVVLSAIIMIYVLIVGSALPGIIVFKFTLNHPEQLTGQAYFKAKLVRLLHRTILIPILVPLLVLAILEPTPAVFGSLIAIAITLLVSYKRSTVY